MGRMAVVGRHRAWSWKMLEADIAVGINYSLSTRFALGFGHPGVSIPTNQRTGVLHARWHHSSPPPRGLPSACTWRTRLHALAVGWGILVPWGRAYTAIRNGRAHPSDIHRRTLPGNGKYTTATVVIEPVAKSYSCSCATKPMLYTYTLARQARDWRPPRTRAYAVAAPSR